MISKHKFSIFAVSLVSAFSLAACHDKNAEPSIFVLSKNTSLNALNQTYIGKKQYRAETPVTEVQQPITGVALAPSIIQSISDQTDLTTDQASQWAFKLDAKLNLLDQQGKKHGTLQQYLTDPQRRTIPVLMISDEATLRALVDIADQVDLTDISLRSSQDKLLRQAYVLLPGTRGVLDLSHNKKLSSSREGLADILHRTNRAFTRIVILPEYMLNKENVAFLQQRLLTVWGSSSASTLAGAARVLASGLNAVITPQSQHYNAVLAAMPEHTLLRKPLLIGHRGVPSLEDENTLASAKKAVALGADIVENDIYITKDNHLVIMHDAMVDRTTNGRGYIEQMTLAEVKQLSTRRGHSVPTLAEYFQVFRDNKSMVHFIEIKSGNDKVIPELKKEIQKYQIEDQVVAISFHVAQIQRMKSQLPEYTTGFLVGKVDKTDNVNADVKTLMEMTQRHSSTFNSSYENITPALLDAAKHRGITVWPWTFRKESVFKQYYLSGLYGLTTDYSQFASRYVVDIKTDPSARTIQVGEPLQFPATLTTQDGKSVQAEANQLILLSSQQASYRDSGSIRYITPGTAYVMPGYRYQIDAAHAYTIFAAPIKVTVVEPIAEAQADIAVAAKQQTSAAL